MYLTKELIIIIYIGRKRESTDYNAANAVWSGWGISTLVFITW